MVTVDANLLIYANDERSPFYSPAREWLSRVLSEQERFGIPIQSLLAFVRITTDKRVFEQPLTVTAAVSTASLWLKRPQVFILSPGPTHWSIYEDLYRSVGGTGRISTDVHLAALAIEHAATLYTADHDFARFTGLLWRNPLESV